MLCYSVGGVLCYSVGDFLTKVGNVTRSVTTAIRGVGRPEVVRRNWVVSTGWERAAVLCEYWVGACGSVV